MDFEKPQDITKEKAGRRKSKSKWESLNYKIRTSFERFILTGVLLISSGIALEVRMSDLKLERYIEYAQNFDTLSDQDNKKLHMQLEEIKKEFKEPVLSYLKKGNESAKNSKETLPATPTVEGFEELNLSNDAVEKLWSERFYPKGTITGNIARIRLVKATNVSMDFLHGIGKNTAASVKNFDDEIIFWENESLGGNFKDEIRVFSDVYFSHELGHINDWVNNNHLTPTERVEFLYDVTEAFKRPDSFRNDYINSQKSQYSKVVEYWGELCRNYLNGGDYDFFQNHEHEISIVKKWLTRNDPKFDVNTTTENRFQERIKIGMLPEEYTPKI